MPHSGGDRALIDSLVVGTCVPGVIYLLIRSLESSEDWDSPPGCGNLSTKPNHPTRCHKLCPNCDSTPGRKCLERGTGPSFVSGTSPCPNPCNFLFSWSDLVAILVIFGPNDLVPVPVSLFCSFYGSRSLSWSLTQSLGFVINIFMFFWTAVQQSFKSPLKEQGQTKD